MLASEAMRIGAALTPKADAVLFDKNGGACALGAIMLGWTGSWDSRWNSPPIRLTFPWLIRIMPCPICGTVSHIDSILAHLNNSPGAYNHGHDISREAIADYLEGVEVELGLRPMPSSEVSSVEVEELELVCCGAG